jgi:adenine-specific DNA methylase
MSLGVISPNLKRTGAYYTADAVADFLVRWVVREPTDRVLDPSFGGGVFLKAAAIRISDNEGDPAMSVHGVELDPDVHREVVRRLAPDVAPDHLTRADFFSLDGASTYDAVVGNPPFVRYQSFNGAARDAAMRRVAEQGLSLPKLASLWAPFVIHATAMLRPGGRLAMVLPMEMFHAAYGRPVLRHLRDRFATLGVLTFKTRLFPDLSQNCVLLLADGFGTTDADAAIHWRDLDGPADLSTLDASSPVVPRSRRLETDALADGRRLIEQFIPKPARDLYRELLDHDAVRRLGDVARVGIGYVSGNNDFFHLCAADAERRGIPADYLTPAVRKGRALVGLRFTTDDWHAAEATGDAAYLLQVPPPLLNGNVPRSLRDYLDEGEAAGVHRAYKCRVRTPWYSVPHVHRADAFLTYMSGRVPRFVVNSGDVVAPNNLHVVRLRDGVQATAGMLATAWPSALTRLSVELEGHAMGGGMLKLEPGEAERIALPPLASNERLDLNEVDALARTGQSEAVAERVDRALLIDGLGLTAADCHRLRSAATTLMERRYAAGKVGAGVGVGKGGKR